MTAIIFGQSDAAKTLVDYHADPHTLGVLVKAAARN